MNKPNTCGHTPGPWQVDDGEITASGFVLGLVYGTDDCPCSEDETREECQANAHLIAAAPQLLQACQKFVQWLNEGQPRQTQNVLSDAERAIAKATGGQP